MDTDRVPDFSAECDNRSAQVIQVDSGKHVAAITVCAVIAGASVVLAAWAAYQASLANTEARMVEYYLQDPSFRSKEELEQWSRYKREQGK